jgi:hypothetical protein
MKRFPSFVNECSENAWGILIVASSKSRVRLFRECLPDCDALSSTVTSPQSARAESYQLCCEIVATDRFAVIRHLTSDRSRGLQSICGSGHQAHLRLLLLGVKVLSFDKTTRALSAKFCSKTDALSGTCRDQGVSPSWPPLCIAKVVPKNGARERVSCFFLIVAID